ncbi:MULTISPECIES: YibE/F family protein [Clostridium]|uniref:YibE/F family protein n=1 Tax=Clostridium TaxID=1485 RepID=UPI00069D1535|nr:MULTISPECIES: YibE/F family protein [Clostridium]KOF57033.1 YibE/F [Clostridium sp. DMHC 10]MCD2348178.1 YibE/F family protein [Clostridium guangxiense]
MNVPFILLIILLILMTLIGGQRGTKSFFTLLFNFIIMFIFLILIGARLNPITVTIVGCIIISFTTLFFINGVNIKTVSSLISVAIVVILTMLITYNIGSNSNIQGFSSEQVETTAYLSVYVNLDFTKIIVCEILFGLLGAIIDVSISISSSMNEIYKSDTSITRINLFKSGMSIGKDILGTMTNTLLFAYIGSFMSLIIYFNELHYSLSQIFNGKVFCSEIFQSLCGGIGIILIIPITAFICSKLLFLKLQPKAK